MSADGFQVVCGKKAARRRNYKPNIATFDRNNRPQKSKSTVMDEISNMRLEIEKSNFLTTLKGIFVTSEIVSESSKPQSDIQDIVCYGLGNFASEYIARYQLTLLIILREHLKVSRDNCHVYDPLFTDSEREILQENNFCVIEENEEGKRPVDRPTLFFMPHCGKALYNNLLWSNWQPDKLQNLVILGNSFNHMQLNTPKRVFQEEGSYIVKVLPHISEHPIPNSFQQSDVFNDSSLHLVDSLSLSREPAEFWKDNPPPIYKDTATDIIRGNSNKL